MGQIKRLFSWRLYGAVFFSPDGRVGTAYAWQQNDGEFLKYLCELWEHSKMHHVSYIPVPGWILTIPGLIEIERLRRTERYESDKWQEVK